MLSCWVDGSIYILYMLWFDSITLKWHRCQVVSGLMLWPLLPFGGEALPNCLKLSPPNSFSAGKKGFCAQWNTSHKYNCSNCEISKWNSCCYYFPKWIFCTKLVLFAHYKWVFVLKWVGMSMNYQHAKCPVIICTTALLYEMWGFMKCWGVVSEF